MDFSSLLTSLGTSFLIFIFLVLVFTWLSGKSGNRVIYFPRRVLKGLDASKSPNPFAWIVEALQATEDDIISVAGLDAAVYLTFFTTALIIMVLSAGVCLLVLVPLSVTDINYRISMEQAKNKTAAIYDDFDKLAMGNIQQESKRLWAFVVAAYWVSVVTYIVLWKTYKHVLQLRAREETSLESKPEQFAILVRDIPPVPAGKTRREQVDSFFRRLYPETFERSLIVTDMSQRSDELRTFSSGALSPCGGLPWCMRTPLRVFWLIQCGWVDVHVRAGTTVGEMVVRLFWREEDWYLWRWQRVALGGGNWLGAFLYCLN